MPDPTSVLEQESRTVQEILDAADGDITTSVTDAELVLVNRATGSKLFLRRNSKIRTADGTVAAITDTLTCRSCKSIISHQASTLSMPSTLRRDASVPGLMALITGEYPSGRYVAKEVAS